MQNECGRPGGPHGAVLGRRKVSREADDDCLWAGLLNTVGGFDAIERGESNIHQDHVGFMRNRHGYRFFPVPRLTNNHDVRMLLEDVLDQLPRPLIIVHEKNAVLSSLAFDRLEGRCGECSGDTKPLCVSWGCHRRRPA